MHIPAQVKPRHEAASLYNSHSGARVQCGHDMHRGGSYSGWCETAE